MLMQRGGYCLCVLAGMFVMASMAMAQEKLPDLMPVVVDADQGYIEVRNIGNAVSEPSQLFVLCSTIHLGKSTPCAAGLNLPGFIEKWNILPIDVPALQPGGSYRVHLFGAGSFPRQTTNYAMKITVDPLKKMAESNEMNNYTRLDIKPKNATKKIEKGQLQVTVLMDGKPIKSAIVLTRPGQMAHEMPFIQRRERMKQTPFEEPWPVGKYDLHIHSEVSSPVNVYMQSQALPIEIKKGKRLEKIITIPSGRLQLATTVEGKKSTGIEVKIATLQGDYESFYGLGVLKTPMDITLPAGQYKLEAKSIEEKQTQTANAEIKAGSTTKKSLNFDKLRIGYLKLNVLMDGKSIAFEFGRAMSGTDLVSDVHLFASETGEPFVPLEIVRNKPIKLRVGIYDLKVRARGIVGRDTVVKRIAIREGETVEKTVEIRQPGTMAIMARWTHQPLNIAACAIYHNPVNFNRLGALMGGGSGAGARSRGKCLNPNVFLRASISSPGRNDGNIAKDIYLKSRGAKNTAGKIDDNVRVQAIDIEPGVYELTVWPVMKGNHRELKQTLKGVEITAGGYVQRKLKFRWPGKK